LENDSTYPQFDEPDEKQIEQLGQTVGSMFLLHRHLTYPKGGLPHSRKQWGLSMRWVKEISTDEMQTFY
jgi:hypothetical protein